MTEGLTQERLNRLESAIAQGTLKVSYGDKFVIYRPLNEMLQIGLITVEPERTKQAPVFSC